MNMARKTDKEREEIDDIKAISKEKREKVFGDTPWSSQIKYDPITPNICKIEMNDRLARSVEGDTAYVSRVEFFSLLQSINHGRSLEPRVFAGSPKDQWENLLRSPYFNDILQVLKSEVVRGRVEKYFKRAIEKEYITIWDGRARFFDDTRDFWGQEKELAVFLNRVLKGITKKREFPHKQLEFLFGVSELYQCVKDIPKRKTYPKQRWWQILMIRVFYDDLEEGEARTIIIDMTDAMTEAKRRKPSVLSCYEKEVMTKAMTEAIAEATAGNLPVSSSTIETMKDAVVKAMTEAIAETTAMNLRWRNLSVSSSEIEAMKHAVARAIAKAIVGNLPVSSSTIETMKDAVVKAMTEAMTEAKRGNLSVSSSEIEAMKDAVAKAIAEAKRGGR